MTYMPVTYPGASFEANCLTSTMARKQPHLIGKFTSPLAFAQYATTGDTDLKREAIGYWARYLRDNSDGDFFGGATSYAEVIGKLATGAPELADKVRAISGRVNAPIERMKMRTVRHVVGGRVCVPDLLAGSPTPMRRKVATADPLAPLTVVVNLTSSAGVSTDSLLTRGIACCALAQHLTTRRQVTLYALLASKPYNSKASPMALVKLRSNPLDLTRAAYVLSDQGFARGVGFTSYGVMCADYTDTVDSCNMVGSDYSDIAWPFGSFNYAAETDANFDSGEAAPITADLSRYLNTEVLYIPGAFVSSKSLAQCADDPAQWVSALVAKYSKPKLVA